MWRAAEKPSKPFLQGLKPIQSRRFTPGLRPRPPKERNFFRKLPVFANISVHDRTFAPACATGWAGRLEAGATKNRERVRDKKGAAGGRGAFAKPNLETGPGYLAFLGAFLSAFLAFFAMQISFRRSIVCCPGMQSE